MVKINTLTISKDFRSGFTLIELLLYITILTTLLLSVVMFFNLTTEARVKSMVINEVNEQGMYMMDYITQSIRNSTAVTSPAAAATGSSLTLTVPTSTQSPTVFAVSSGTLTVTKGSNSSVELDSQNIVITNFIVTNATRSGTNGIVRIAFTLTYMNNTSRNEYNYSRNFMNSAEISW